MERYHFFTSSCVQFGVRAPSLAHLHRDESETEGILAVTLRTLRAIHHDYFNGDGGQVNHSIYIFLLLVSVGLLDLAFHSGLHQDLGLAPAEDDVQCLCIKHIVSLYNVSQVFTCTA